MKRYATYWRAEVDTAALFIKLFQIFPQIFIRFASSNLLGIKWFTVVRGIFCVCQCMLTFTDVFNYFSSVGNKNNHKNMTRFEATPVIKTLFHFIFLFIRRNTNSSIENKYTWINLEKKNKMNIIDWPKVHICFDEINDRFSLGNIQ